MRPVKVPYKAIFIASCMFISGSLLIITGVMLLTGYIDAKVWKQDSNFNYIIYYTV